jgi:hypothetical protein
MGRARDWNGGNRCTEENVQEADVRLGAGQIEQCVPAALFSFGPHLLYCMNFTITSPLLHQAGSECLPAETKGF